MITTEMELKNIPGFPDYCATKDGRIWSKKTERYLKPSLCDGYFHVVLCENPKRYTKLVHHLILETFIGPCPNGKECCHYNRTRTDNRLANLRWGTRNENQKDAVRHGTHSCLRLGENSNVAKLTESDVRMVVYMYRTGLFSQKEVAKVYNVHQVTISHIIIKKNWRHIWK